MILTCPKEIMFRGTASRVAVASAVVLVAGAALAVPARADDGPIGPKQYFCGEVFTLSASTALNGIEVACAGRRAGLRAASRSRQFGRGV